MSEHKGKEPQPNFVNRNGLMLDYDEKKADIRPLPGADNLFGTLAFLVIKELKLQGQQPSGPLLLEIIDPNTRLELDKDKGWTIDYVPVSDEQLKAQHNLDRLEDNIGAALRAFEGVIPRLERNGIDYQRYLKN